MKTVYKDIETPRYTIKTKYYLPEEGRITAVILGIHGFAGDKESSALNALAKQATLQHIVLLSFDLPAHGQSPAWEDQLTIQNCMADIAFMADLCRKEYPDVEKRIFATSYGGFLALLCADFLEDFKIVLRAPAVTMPEHILTDLIQLSPEEFRHSGPVQCGFERSLMLPYSFYEELQQYCVFDKEYKNDMLVIHGDLDDVVPHEDIIAFCEKYKNMKLVVIKGCDHRFKNPGEIEIAIEAALDFWKN